jgi:hypothetical protein
MWYWIWEHLFLDISSTNTDTLVASLYQCFESRSIEVLTVVSATSAPPLSAKSVPPRCEPLYATNTSQHKQETFLYECPLHWVLLTTKKAQQNDSLRQYTPQAWSPFWLLKPASKHAHARLLPWDCHEAGLCCYLVIHIENFIRPLQLFYFHLWLFLLILPRIRIIRSRR